MIRESYRRKSRVVEISSLGSGEGPGWATGPGYGVPRLDGLPGREETIARYEELTGRPVEHALWYEVFAAVRFGLIMARIALRMEEIGLPAPNPDFDLNNPNTQRLAVLLGLPPP